MVCVCVCVCVCVFCTVKLCVVFKIVQILKIYVSLNCLSQFFLELQKKKKKELQLYMYLCVSFAVVYVLMCFICMICFIEYTGET